MKKTRGHEDMSKKIVIVGDFFSTNPHKIQLGRNLESIIQEADVTICNFEGPVVNEFEPLAKSGPNIAQSIDSIQFLKQIGFNTFIFGNNHAMDYGEQGLKYTLNLFGKNDVLGAGYYDQAYRTLRVDINNVKIGLIALCQFEFGMSESKSKSYGVAWINDPIVNRIVAQAREEVDYLIILPHAGVENIDIPLPEWRERYKELIELGADAIIAGHPHVPQGKETYKGKKIYYSLGNFFFERMNSKEDRHTHSILVEIKIDSEKKINIVDKVVKRSGYTIDILRDYEGNEYIKKLNNLIGDSDKYEVILDKTIKNLWKTIYKRQLFYALRKPSLWYGIIFNIKIIVKSILKKNDKLLLLNCFQCESHRWVIERALRSGY